MASLGNNYGSSSHLRDLETMYKIASVVNDAANMERCLESIKRSSYAESTKVAALRRLNKWELNRKADAIIGRNE